VFGDVGSTHKCNSERRIQEQFTLKLLNIE